MSRLERALLRRMSRANREHDLVAPGDRIMVACSGGKDSFALLHLLRAYRAMVPFSFEIIAMNLDQGHPGFPVATLRDHFEREGFAYHLVHQDTHRVVKDKLGPGQTMCSLCSRLRRGVLYRVAAELGATKIALGHHRDDAIETLLLNLFFAGSVKSMPPRLVSDDGRHVVIRPLCHCGEDDIAAYAAERQFPIIPCDLCGSQEDLQRKRIKRLLTELEAENPGIRRSLLAALGNVVPSHLFDRALQRQRPANPPLPVLRLVPDDAE